MSLRAQTGRLAVLVWVGALVPSSSTGRELDPDTPTILVVGPAALDVSRAAPFGPRVRPSW